MSVSSAGQRGLSWDFDLKISLENVVVMCSLDGVCVEVRSSIYEQDEVEVVRENTSSVRAICS